MSFVATKVKSLKSCLAMVKKGYVMRPYIATIRELCSSLKTSKFDLRAGQSYDFSNASHSPISKCSLIIINAKSLGSELVSQSFQSSCCFCILKLLFLSQLGTNFGKYNNLSFISD